MSVSPLFQLSIETMALLEALTSSWSVTKDLTSYQWKSRSFHVFKGCNLRSWYVTDNTRILDDDFYNNPRSRLGYFVRYRLGWQWIICYIMRMRMSEGARCVCGFACEVACMHSAFARVNACLLVMAYAANIVTYLPN